MDYNKLLFFNYIASYVVIIPILLCLFNFKLILKYNKWLFVYLICSLFAEAITGIMYFVYNTTFNISGLVFDLIETTLFLLIISEWSSKPLKKLYLITISTIFGVFIFDFLFAISPPFYTLTVSISRITLLFCLVFFLIKNTTKVEKYAYTSIYSMLFFVVCTTTIYSFVEFFTFKIEYRFIYSFIINIANIIYYVLFTISILQLKRFYISTEKLKQ